MDSKRLRLPCGFLLLVGIFVASASSFPVTEIQSGPDYSVNSRGMLVKASEEEREIIYPRTIRDVEASPECTYTNPQKILIGVIAIMALLSVIGCFICCRSLCTEQGIPPGGSAIVYQSMTRHRNVHAGNCHHMEPIPEGRCMPEPIPVEDQPPPYFTTTEPVTSGKRW